jgi:hypothetical protein
VAIFKEFNAGNPVFAATIDAHHAVDANNYFGGTGVANFSLNVSLLQSESLRFVVFSDSQGQDGTFDATAFRTTINQVPEPGRLLLMASACVEVIWLGGKRRRNRQRASVAADRALR